MRTLFGFIVLTTMINLGCQSCPDGNADNSLFCHGASCSAEESVCGGACSNLQSDRDNCGACGTACGDGLVCSFGACVEGCAGGLVSCGGSCIDQSSDEANCGGCGTGELFTCATGESCIDGVCGCAAGELVCGGTCTNPATSDAYCGATGDCAGGNAGQSCGANEACLNGDCVTTQIYRGSLPAATGRWNYQNVLGMTGANNECAARWPGSAVCTYDKLLAASTKAVPETTNAVDFNNVAVTSWWVDDAAALGTQRCQSNADGIPWSYGTADEGKVGKFVTLTPATGAITALETGTLPSCNGTRNVACCSILTAP